MGDRFAELMIKAVPADPDRLATKDDLALLGASLRTEMAELRTELKTEMAGLRVEMRDLTAQQTRTMAIALVGSVTALAVTQLLLGVIG